MRKSFTLFFRVFFFFHRNELKQSTRTKIEIQCAQKKSLNLNRVQTHTFLFYAILKVFAQSLTRISVETRMKEKNLVFFAFTAQFLFRFFSAFTMNVCNSFHIYKLVQSPFVFFCTLFLSRALVTSSLNIFIRLRCEEKNSSHFHPFFCSPCMKTNITTATTQITKHTHARIKIFTKL